MICEEVFNLYDENSIDDFYSFLFYIIPCIKQDIYKFICLIQDDNFDKEKILRENPEEFSIYLKYKHFR